ncbi:hypothetical protein Pcinc_009188 [Petrolisthes cinctipes]|uniref:Uncharacterized protein n=1 Tax=Petrolisthes cinctipes TaxID=88211 RepID=A0AAE1FWJ7_PETCI|nr:hypothetical protein Pcinc_013688 [Petrolisthes cinctipes]KAK3885530.1 hypothetical protein Pcinc_010271 [Petrolisthes cinctipes]KAK3886671.1 hypothetical protein Pcinc_009188 [Petrolisthes cinctipes]
MSQHRIPCNMAFPTPSLQDMPGHMALPTPPQQDTNEYYTDELEMNSLLINNLKIQLYLTHLLNNDQQQKKKRGRKARLLCYRSIIVRLSVGYRGIIWIGVQFLGNHEYDDHGTNTMNATRQSQERTPIAIR